MHSFAESGSPLWKVSLSGAVQPGSRAGLPPPVGTQPVTEDPVHEEFH